MPMRRSPSRRSMLAPVSAATRVSIRPTVRQATRSSSATATLEVWTASHAAVSSNARVKPTPWRAQGTAATTTPWRRRSPAAPRPPGTPALPPGPACASVGVPDRGRSQGCVDRRCRIGRADRGPAAPGRRWPLLPRRTPLARPRCARRRAAAPIASRTARRSTPLEPSHQTAGNLAVGRRAVMETAQVTHESVTRASFLPVFLRCFVSKMPDQPS
jgi:hypothetical protein